MDEMVADMRNRFVVAAVLSVPVLLWSPIGREVFGFTVPAPFGLRDDVFSLLLSLPVIFYSAWVFFDGAYRALRARKRRCERGSPSPARVKLFTPASPVPQAAGLSASAMLIRAGKGTRIVTTRATAWRRRGPLRT